MTKQEMLNYGQSVLNRIVDVILALPKGAGAMINVTNRKGMSFYEGGPFTTVYLATTDDELTELLAGVHSFYDVRTNTMYQYIGGQWYTSPGYTGTSKRLRYNSLVMATNSGKVFFFTDQGTYIPVDVTNPTP